MKVSGSILATKDNYLSYSDELKHAKIDFLHVDIFQNGEEFKIKDLLMFDDRYLPLDVHLIFREITEDDIDILNKSNALYLSVQYENLEDKESIIEIGKSFNGRFGIAITSKTPLDVIEKYIGCISHVLFMCSEPGVSGAKFDDANFKRIAMTHNEFPTLSLYADGGINKDIAERMSQLGVSMVVSGSYLCKDVSNLGNKVYSLKYNGEDNVEVTRNMLSLKELPIVEDDASFAYVIDTMSKYRMGITMVFENGSFQGIITDGEVRRGFLKYGKEIFDKKAGELANFEPFTVQSGTKMDELVNLLYGLHKGIEVIPVMEGDNLIGAVDMRMGY